MRTLAAQPRRVERLCQETSPGRSRYSCVPSFAAIQSTTGSLLERSVPLGTAGGWGRSSGRTLLVSRWSGGGGGREDLGWPQAKPVFWDSVTLIPLLCRPTAAAWPVAATTAVEIMRRRPASHQSGWMPGRSRTPASESCSLGCWGRRGGWPVAAPVRLRLAGRPVAQCLRNLSILKTSFLWSMW